MLTISARIAHYSNCSTGPQMIALRCRGSRDDRPSTGPKPRRGPVRSDQPPALGIPTQPVPQVEPVPIGLIDVVLVFVEVRVAEEDSDLLLAAVEEAEAPSTWAGNRG